MALLNYSTSIAPEKTIAEIQAKLAKAGAFQILHEYHKGTGELIGLSFRIETEFGNLAFELPARIDAVEAVLQKQFKRGDVRRGFTKREQAVRVAWRILKDWIEAQLALIETGMVSVEQIFLPFCQSANGETLFEAIKRKRFAGLLMEGKADPALKNL
jgi:hypothetical protein